MVWARRYSAIAPAKSRSFMRALPAASAAWAARRADAAFADESSVAVAVAAAGAGRASPAAPSASPRNTMKLATMPRARPLDYGTRVGCFAAGLAGAAVPGCALGCMPGRPPLVSGDAGAAGVVVPLHVPHGHRAGRFVLGGLRSIVIAPLLI